MPRLVVCAKHGPACTGQSRCAEAEGNLEFRHLQACPQVFCLRSMGEDLQKRQDLFAAQHPRWTLTRRAITGAMPDKLSLHGHLIRLPTQRKTLASAQGFAECRSLWNLRYNQEREFG